MMAVELLKRLAENKFVKTQLVN